MSLDNFVNTAIHFALSSVLYDVPSTGSVGNGAVRLRCGGYMVLSRSGGVVTQ